jgi:hypothetical protein
MQSSRIRGIIQPFRRAQRPRGLRHELSSQAHGSWVPIPLEVLMFVLAIILFVLSCVQEEALRQADPLPRSPTDCVDKETEKAA